MKNRLVIFAALPILVGLVLPSLAFAQTNYAAEARSDPDAAKRPTPKMADGHPDLNGVWHRFFGINVIRYANGIYTADLNGAGPAPKAGAPAPPPQQADPKPEYKPEFAAKVKYLDANQV